MSIERIEVGANSILHDPDQLPFHTHDCNECIHLTSTQFRGGWNVKGVVDERYDLYYCKASSLDSEPNIISRTSSEPSEYASGLCFAKSAFERAKKEHLDYQKPHDRHEIALALAYHLSTPMLLRHEDAVRIDGMRINEKALRKVHLGAFDLVLAFKGLWRESYVWNKEALDLFEEFGKVVEREGNEYLTDMYNATLAFARKET